MGGSLRPDEASQQREDRIMVHLHARISERDFCDTVCGLHCDAVDTAYRGLDPERVTCQTCAADL